MDVLSAGPDDEARIRACYAVYTAAETVDDPYTPPMPYHEFRATIRYIWADKQGETWMAADQTAYLRLHLPDYDNTNVAILELAVHPDHRRQGTGSALLSFAAGRCGELARTTILAGAWIGSPGEEFLRRHAQFSPGITEVRRILRVGDRPTVTVAAGYSLVRWEGATPPERLRQSAQLQEMLNDAPHDASWEPERWDTARIQRMDRHNAERGRRVYSIAAIAESGEMAALTQVAVNEERREWGWQDLTAVARAHRGHRLGMTIKSAMIDWLASVEPQIEQIVTWNAEQNKHMIAINEALGFEVLGVPSRSWERGIE
jgi:GNAT superfamily N-acetyltransferase